LNVVVIEGVFGSRNEFIVFHVIVFKSSLPLKKCVVSIKRYFSLIKLTIVFIITMLDFFRNKTHHPQGTPRRNRWLLQKNFGKVDKNNQPWLASPGE